VRHTMSNERPQLLPGLRPLWRGRRSLQFGREPGRTVVVDGIDTTTAAVLTGLDGRRAEAEVLADATAAGFEAAAIGRMLAGLRRCGLVVDAEPMALSDLGAPDTAERLAPDCAALSLSRPHRGPLGTLRQRQQSTVAVHGGGRLGAPVATLLAAAGVGRLTVIDGERARPCDAAPGGISPGDAYRPRGEAVIDAVRRAAPEVDAGPPHPGRLPDLAVLAGTEPVEPGLRAALHRMGVPHLPVYLRDGTAVLGPLVVPGVSSCLTCADLHRRDRDPAWPMLAAQLSVPRRRQREPADVVLASLAAALAAAQVLTLLDGEDPATLDGTLEVRPPDWQVRRRTWLPHPLCGCGAARPARPRLAA
jgi:bacteriocin biosynthesis cyclodehydratase domain-containing protein